MNGLRRIGILFIVIAFFAGPLSMLAQVTWTLPGSSGITRTSAGQDPMVTACGWITATTATQPSALANFAFTQNGILTTEAGVAASMPTTAARIFVDYNPVSGANSGVAVGNPSNSAITVSVQLNNAQGNVTTCPSQTVPAEGHLALFASQLCPNISSPFLGTLTLTSSLPFVATTLLSGSNSHGEALYNSLPVAAPGVPPAGSSLYFSQFADGGGFNTTVLLMNLTGTPITGRVSFFGDGGQPVTLNFGGSNGSANTLNYSIPANGMQKFVTTGSTLGTPLQAGSVVVTSTSGALPSGAVIFSQYNAIGGLASQAGVLNSPVTTSSRMYVEKSSSDLTRNTGLAIFNPNNSPATIQLNLVSLDGSFAASNAITLPANNHMAGFINQSGVMGAAASSVPANFQGVLALSSNQPIAPVTLRLTANQRGENLYSSLPVADLNNPRAGLQYLPQIADGSGFNTQIILINTTSSSGTITIIFYNDGGNLVPIPFTPGPIPTLQEFTLIAASVAGGGSVNGTVTLSGAAPAGVVQVSLSSNNSNVHVPPTVSIATGQSSATFTVTTSAVTSTQTATITATLGTVQKSVTLTVTPPNPPQWQKVDIYGTVMLDGKPVNLDINVFRSVPMAAVLNYDAGSLILLQLLFDQQVDFNGNTVTFNGVNSSASVYQDFNASFSMQPVMSGTLSLTINSPMKGASVSGQLQFTTVDGTTRQSAIIGTILSISN